MKTILIIHGWDNKNYTRYGGTDAWENRIDFVNILAKDFTIIRFNLPGFCGEPEPDKDWNLVDFADHLQAIVSKQGLPDIVLGYSFGAAVALNWKTKFASSSKLILVSPAITRSYKQNNGIQKVSFFKKIIPKSIVHFFRDLYLKKIGNRFYIDGTNFLRNTYLNIVKVDLSAQLEKLTPSDLLLIFGSDDTATPPSLLLNKVTDPIKERVEIIKGGNHNIAQTHFTQIAAIINKHFGNNSHNT